MQKSSFFTKGSIACLCLAALVCLFMPTDLFAADVAAKAAQAVESAEVAEAVEKSKVQSLWDSTGLKGFFERGEPTVDENGVEQPGQHGIFKLIMILVGLLLIYLGIAKKFEPLLLLPIGFGGILANIPYAGIAEPGGFLYAFYEMGIGEVPIFPLLIFLGVGAMTDFGPLLANPKTALLGAAAQFGIFTTLIGALWLSSTFGSINFSIQDASAIGIIGGADGPTAIFLAGQLAPDLLGAIAVAAYSYMALVPIIQPPIMRLLTTKAEREIEMKQLRPVRQIEKIVFPLAVLIIWAPSSRQTSSSQPRPSASSCSVLSPSVLVLVPV